MATCCSGSSASGRAERPADDIARRELRHPCRALLMNEWAAAASTPARGRTARSGSMWYFATRWSCRRWASSRRAARLRAPLSAASSRSVPAWRPAAATALRARVDAGGTVIRHHAAAVSASGAARPSGRLSGGRSAPSRRASKSRSRRGCSRPGSRHSRAGHACGHGENPGWTRRRGRTSLLTRAPRPESAHRRGGRSSLIAVRRALCAGHRRRPSRSPESRCTGYADRHGRVRAARASPWRPTMRASSSGSRR